MRYLIVLLALASVGYSTTPEEAIKGDDFLFVSTYAYPARSVDPLVDTSVGTALFSQIVYGQFAQDIGAKIGSHLVEFVYDPSISTIIFTLKGERKFSNGNEIHPEDLAFTIKRFLRCNPNHPVLSEIHGIKDWLRKGAKPEDEIEGLIIGHKDLTVKLFRKHQSDYIQGTFFDERLSIVPRRCFDSQYALKCKSIPYSGTHDPIDINPTEKRVVKFKGYTSKFTDFTLLYLTNDELANHSSKLMQRKNILIGVNAYGISQTDLTLFHRSLNMVRTYQNKGIHLVINDKSGPLSDPKTRIFLAEEIRKEISRKKIHVNRSFFPAIMSGFVSPNNIAPCTPRWSFSSPEMIELASYFKKQPLKILIDWGTTDQIFFEIIKVSLQKNGIPYEEVFISDRSKIERQWKKGEISLSIGQSNFRTVNPKDEAIKIFSQKEIELAGYSSDKEIKSYIAGLESDPYYSSRQLNDLLLEQGKIIVLSNFSRFFFTDQKPHNKIALGNMDPSPTGLIGQPLFKEVGR